MAGDSTESLVALGFISEPQNIYLLNFRCFFFNVLLHRVTFDGTFITA